MRLIRIYLDAPLTVDQEVELDDSAAHHLLNVLRLSVGDEILLFNNLGGEYEAEISFAKKAKARALVKQHINIDRESPCQIHLYQGISRGDRMDFSLQKATELGVAEITPVFCERSQFKSNAKQLEKKMQHWQQILISAAQQSWRCTVPRLNSPVSLDEALAADDKECRLFFHTSSEELPKDAISNSQNISVYIGPEGGFSDAEFEQAQASTHTIQLGPRILRTETATVAALSLIQFLSGDFDQA